MVECKSLRRISIYLMLSLLFISVGSLSYGLCVSADVANLRTGPGNNFELSWTVGKYTPLKEIKRKNGWIQVSDVDGEKHWIYRRLVSSRLSCLTVKSKVANLRTGPGSNFGFSKYKQADKYSSFKKLDREGHWFKVQDSSGEVAWVADSLVWRPLKTISIEF